MGRKPTKLIELKKQLKHLEFQLRELLDQKHDLQIRLVEQQKMVNTNYTALVELREKYRQLATAFCLNTNLNCFHELQLY